MEQGSSTEKVRRWQIRNERSNNGAGRKGETVGGKWGLGSRATIGGDAETGEGEELPAIDVHAEGSGEKKKAPASRRGRWRVKSLECRHGSVCVDALPFGWVAAVARGAGTG